MAVWFEIFAADALSAYRNLVRRLTKNRLYALWFIVLVVFSAGALVWLTSFIVRTSAFLAFPVSINDVLFLLFLMLMGKALMDAYHIFLERSASVFVFVQPLKTGSVVMGKFASITAFNMAILTLALGMGTAMTFIGPEFHFVIPPDIVADCILLTLLASSAGLTYGILSGLSTWPRKLAGAALFSPLISVLWLAMGQLRLSGWELTISIAGVYLASLLVLPLCTHLVVESWNTMTSSRASAHPSRRAFRPSRLSGPIMKYLGIEALAIFEKEVRTLMRRREGVGNAITIAGFVGFAVYMSDRMETFIDIPGRLEWIVPVFVVGICIFLAATVLCLIPALGVLSKEGKAAWALRVSPVAEEKVSQGKALSVFLMAPFIVAFVAVPLPLLTGMSWYACLFAALGGLAMCALHTGIGIWYGAKYPNFDEGAGNAPDAMTMYIVMLVALGASLILLGPALAVALQDRVLGILALVFAVDLSFLVLIAGMRGAARQMKVMELAN